jgi:hypothetical protein
MIGNISRTDAAARYKPEECRVLFIAGTPPDADDRYFYFEDVRGQDWLWLGLMKALYPREFGNTCDERKRKGYWLARFSNCGCQLIDAVEVPLSGTDAQKRPAIVRNIPRLLSVIRELDPNQIVVIKTNVHAALYRPLVDAGVNVVNDMSLPFPCSGKQTEFQRQFECLIAAGKLTI